MDKLKEKPNTETSDKLKREQDLFKKACRLIFAHKKLRTETLKEYDEMQTQIAMQREKQWRKNERKKHREFREQIMRAREIRAIEEQASKAEEELKERQKGVVRRELLQQWISQGEKTFEERLCEIHFWEEIEREHKEVVRRHNEYELMYYKLFQDVNSIDTTSSSSEETTGKQKDEFSEVREINLPLTEEARKSMQYKIKEEKEWKKIIVEKNLKKHLKSVKKIKKRMLATRAAHNCHREERMRREAGKKRQMMDALRTKLNIDIHTLPRGGAAVLERYEQYEREKAELKKGQAQRRDEIVGRLLREQVIAMNTRLARRGAPRAQDFTINTGSVADLTKPRLVPSHFQVPVKSVWEDKEWRYYVQERESRRTLESVPVVDRPAKETKNDRFAMEEAIHQDKDDQKLRNVRNENDEESSEQLKTQIDQAESSHRPPPEPPRRYRIEGCDMMSSFKVIHRQKDALARDLVEHMGVPPTSRPIDTAISWRPPVALFNDFRPGHIYQRTIAVRNVSRTKVVSWFDTLLLDDDTDPKVIQVESLDCQRLWPGSSFNFTLTFQPVSYTPELTGHVVFLTRRDGLQVEEFRVPINCLAARPEPRVSPLDIRFNTVPGWTRRRHGVVLYKSVQVSNVGARPCVCRIVTLAEEERGGYRRQELKIYLEDHESENLKTIQNANQDQQIEINLTASKKESISFEQSQKSIKSFKISRITLQSDGSNGVSDTAETFLRSFGLDGAINRATQTSNSLKTANVGTLNKPS
uniref:Uncharacterized protein n=1 Tax=Timema poppense TaxID=170557 RepID=A0A7R9CY52_TIMPO|nr:unnamed protein product [Timema poppensis]